MDARIVIPLAFTLVSHTATVPQVHGAVNSGNYEVIVAGLPVEGHVQLKALTRADRAGLLRVSIDVEASRMRCGAPRSLAR